VHLVGFTIGVYYGVHEFPNVRGVSFRECVYLLIRLILTQLSPVCRSKRR
jgi:hypothetical protein